MPLSKRPACIAPHARPGVRVSPDLTRLYCGIGRAFLLYAVDLTSTSLLQFFLYVSNWYSCWYYEKPRRNCRFSRLVDPRLLVRTDPAPSCWQEGGKCKKNLNTLVSGRFRTYLSHVLDWSWTWSRLHRGIGWLCLSREQYPSPSALSLLFSVRKHFWHL